jgi:mannose-1-phosphate guanylyltransferase
MQINYCLILAAGFGTRMGVIGQKLPKVLWPIFEKSILELQVAYARSLGIDKIYINLHYMGVQIHDYCKRVAAFEGVTFLWEDPEILDIGGAIHNLASQSEINYAGKVLILNGDQFFYIHKDQLQKILTPFEDNSAILFTYWVNSSLGYNALKIDNKRKIKGIIKNNEISAGKTIETYTGISIIDLSALEKIAGESKFFETVCPITKKDFPALLLEQVDYWDFGTLKRYWETMFKILRTYKANPNHPFLRFLVKEKALKTWKIDLQNLSYHSNHPDVINLNENTESKLRGPAIFLSGYLEQVESSPTIVWNDLQDQVR